MPDVQLPTGVFTAPVYESFLSPFQPGMALQVGANIKLIFTPQIELAATRDIRLLQFRNAINPAGWAVDRNGPLIWPYFGWGDAGAPNVFHATAGAQSLAAEGHTCGAGGVTTGISVREAFLVDPPREPTGAPVIGANGLPSWTEKRAVYTVYAYDLINNHWLGGVSWGYVLSWNNGAPQVTLMALSLRSRTSPPGHFPPAAGVAATEESLAATGWGPPNPIPIAYLAPNRVVVPGW